MGSKLILVEGIPGAGKTTTARKIKEELIEEGKKAVLYEEGMSHPADMSWNSYLSEEEYNNFLSKCLERWETSERTVSKDELKHIIERQVRREDNHVILAYTKLEFPEDIYWSLVGEVAAKEIFDGRRSLEEFTEIHLKRWKRFGEEALLGDSVYIFECAFLQNHIFELLGVYEKSDEEILIHLTNLLNTVKCLNPRIVYIEPTDVEKVIMKAADERKAPNESRKDWIDEIADWVSNNNYGRTHGLKGKEGVFAFCKERLRIDKVMIKNLGVPVTIINRE